MRPGAWLAASCCVEPSAGLPQIDDLDAPVLAGLGCVGIFQVVLAEALGRKTVRAHPGIVDEEIGDCAGAAQREVQVVAIAARGVGMPGDDDPGVCQRGIVERLAQFDELLDRARIDPVRS